jgi:hypothetical protein
LTLASALFISACGTASATPTPAFKPGVTIIAPQAPATDVARVETPAIVAATATDASVTAPAEAPTVTQNSPSAADTVPSAPIVLGPDVNPYTGLPLSADARVRKPVLFKVANTVEVRPQSGLGAADVVVEHLSEGGITRFTALYLGSAPKRIGSVRSCRLIDIELPVMFDAAIVCSGTSPGVKPLMRNSFAHRNNLTMISDFGPFECQACPMYRSSDRSAPHNLFGNAENAWKELTKRGKNAASAFRAWQFSTQAGPEGKPTASIDVGYKSGVVGWRYDAASGTWLRSLSGKAQIDANSGQQIGAANVVVVLANHVTTLIQEDVTGSKSIEIQIWGEGPVRIFRDGREYGGKWKRGADLGSFEFFDPAGNKLSLKPGATWIQMVPLSGNDASVATK